MFYLCFGHYPSVLNDSNKLGLQVGLIYSLLERLITVICVFKHLIFVLNPENSRFTAHNERSRKVLLKKSGKNVPSLNENIPNSEGERRVPRASIKKNRPQVVYKFSEPPCFNLLLCGQQPQVRRKVTSNMETEGHQLEAPQPNLV